MNDDWLIWQLVDSAFPVGGFAHSSGLEAAWQHGEVAGREGLAGFVEASLHQAGASLVPWVTAAHREPGRLQEWDRLCHTWISNHVANRASRLQGRAFWTAAHHAFGPPAAPGPPGSSTARVIPGPCPDHAHLPPVFGAVLRYLHIGEATTARMFLFLHLRGVISAGVRLGILGPLQAQSLQHAFAPIAEAVARDAADLGVEEVAQTSFLLDLWQGAHDRLYSRLFQS